MVRAALAALRPAVLYSRACYRVHRGPAVAARGGDCRLPHGTAQEQPMTIEIRYCVQ